MTPKCCFTYLDGCPHDGDAFEPQPTDPLEPHHFVRVLEGADPDEVAEAEKTNVQLINVLKAVDEATYEFHEGKWDCPFCNISSDHPMRIRHEEGCIVLVARQVMHDADIETEFSHWERQLEDETNG